MTPFLLVAMVLVPLLCLGFGVLLVKRLLQRAGANEVLVVTGPRRPRYLTSHLQVPLLELVDRLDLRPLEVSVPLPDARGRVVARAKIAAYELSFEKAARLLLDLPRSEQSRIVECVLLVAAQEVLPQVEDDEVAVHKIIEEAEPELARLGLALDSVRREP